MRISELAAFHAAIPLRRTVRHASYTRRANDALLVRCRLDDGTEGWGEGLPRPYVTGETIESAFEQLRAADLRRQLDGRMDGLRDAIAFCDRLKLPLPAGAVRDCFGNSVRCAVELSVLDAAARAEGRPLSHVTPLVPETLAIRAAHQRVRYSAAVTSLRPLKQVAHALFVRLHGFEHVKVKVGAAGVDDERSLARVRRWAGPRVDLRIDANEAWTCETLEAKLAPLLPFRISACEQPVPHVEVDGLAHVRPRLPVPIMLDESLCSQSDAERAIERGLCDLFNIRLSKCGGFVSSLRLAALAHRAGLGFQLGCQVGETGILSAAGRHFACSVAGLRYLEGSFDRYLVREPLTRQDLTFGRGGWAPALAGSGLGIDIDPAALQRVTVAEEHWTI
ncbi:MAG TPA: dipeptide epimerase [Planctomycetaceae bacterium]|nr:dipeptide epimerase [Planctomycetaceae bacterium]